MKVSGKFAVIDTEGQRQIARKNPTARQLRARDKKQADNIENPTVDVSARTLVSETWQSWWESPRPLVWIVLVFTLTVPLIRCQLENRIGQCNSFSTSILGYEETKMRLAASRHHQSRQSNNRWPLLKVLPGSSPMESG